MTKSGQKLLSARTLSAVCKLNGLFQILQIAVSMIRIHNDIVFFLYGHFVHLFLYQYLFSPFRIIQIPVLPEKYLCHFSRRLTDHGLRVG